MIWWRLYEQGVLPPKEEIRGLTDCALSNQEVDCLLQVLEIDSTTNLFDRSVRMQNRVIILLEYELGIRVGELLGIWVEDFNFSSNTINSRKKRCARP